MISTTQKFLYIFHYDKYFRYHSVRGTLDTDQTFGALADILRCNVDQLSSSYLGLPLGFSFKVKSVWGVMVERF